MNRCKRMIVVFLLLDLMVCTAGCKRNDNNRREINSIDFVRMVAIDAAQDEPEKMEVTLELQGEDGGNDNGADSGGGQNGEQSKLISATGGSFSEAFLQLQTEHGKLLNLAHSDYFLIGEEAAGRGLTPYMDFISRNNQIQFSADVFIVKGMRAAEFMSRFGEANGMVSSQLKNMAEKTRDLSYITNTSVIQVMGMLDNASHGMKIPYLELQEKGEKQVDMEMSGYALFRDTALVDYADTEASRGMNFFSGEVYSGLIPVRDTEGEAVVTRISDAKTKVKVRYEQNELRVQVNAEIHTTLEETHSKKNLFLPEEYDVLMSQQNQYVKNLMLRAVQESKENRIDALSLADSFRMQHPIIWEDLKENWTQRLEGARFEVNVSSRMDRSYDYEEANRYGQS